MVKLLMLTQISAQHAKTGYAVLPLYEPTEHGCSCGDPDCSRAGKHPRIKEWKDGASKDPVQVALYWAQHPYANIGIATGEPSKIFVVDVDGEEGRKTLATLMPNDQPFPLTSKVLTGRGEHYYFNMFAAMGGMWWHLAANMPQATTICLPQIEGG